MAGTCEYGDEPSGSIKCGGFIIIRESTELTVSTVVKCYVETVMLKLSNFTP